VHREKVYSYNLGVDSREGEYSYEINMKFRPLCIKFINKALSSSLLMDVGQVWADHIKLCVLLLVSFNIHLSR